MADAYFAEEPRPSAEYVILNQMYQNWQHVLDLVLYLVVLDTSVESFIQSTTVIIDP